MIEVNIERSDLVPGCPWPAQCWVEYGIDLTAHELASALAINLLGADQLAALGFALGLREEAISGGGGGGGGGSAADAGGDGGPASGCCFPVHHATRVTDICRELAANSPAATKTVWLRYHAIPRDPVTLMKSDTNVFQYFLVQTANEFVAGEACVEITEPETMALGVLLLRHYHAHTAASFGPPKLEAWLTIEKELGLASEPPINPFFSLMYLILVLIFFPREVSDGGTPSPQYGRDEITIHQFLLSRLRSALYLISCVLTGAIYADVITFQ